MSAQLLQDRDYTILIARSHASRDRAHPWHREWIEAQTALIDLAKQCQQFDPDGLTIYEVSGMILKYSQSDVVTFARILQQNHRQSVTVVPEMSVLEAIKDAFDDYSRRKADGKIKKGGEIIVAVIDYQEADTVEAIANLIIEVTESLESNEDLGISFIQIGNDEFTRKFLTSLDNDLPRMGATFDIVDTKYWHEIPRQSIAQFLVDAIHD
ncbi:MAG: hypothetical protein ACP5D7_05445 [Limnospira sp.]